MNLNCREDRMRRKVTIIEIYVPSENEKINTKNQFFTKLNGIIADIGNTRELFLFGDFKHRTERVINSKIVGLYGKERYSVNQYLQV
jgi:exonuclease III